MNIYFRSVPAYIFSCWLSNFSCFNIITREKDKTTKKYLVNYYFKLNFINLKFPIYHINHVPGKKYSINKKISIKKIKDIKLDFINNQKLFSFIKNYRLKKLHKDDKRKDWGLAKEKLSIYKI